jgi:hypothetical protein
LRCFTRRFAEVKAFYEKPEGRNGRADLKIAAIAAADGSATAIQQSRSLPEATRKTTLLGAVQYLVAIGEYAKAETWWKRRAIRRWRQESNRCAGRLARARRSIRKIR